MNLTFDSAMMNEELFFLICEMPELKERHCDAQHVGSNMGGKKEGKVKKPAEENELAKSDKKKLKKEVRT